VIDHKDGKRFLESLMNQHNWSIKQLAVKIGDCPVRLTKVINGEEALGKTAELAAIAVKNRLSPIENS